MTDLPDISAMMGELARRLQAEGSVEATLREMTSAGVDTIPGAEFASVTLVRERHAVDTRAATDPVVKQIDEAQYASGEGPCLTALWEAQIVRVDDIATDTRWPRWVDRISDSGVRSMLCLRLYVHEHTLAALNLYASKPHAFDEESERVSGLFGAHAAVALSASETERQLHAALDTRDVIGMAKGILIERYKITPESAFAMLVRASQVSNIKLNELARITVETGQAPSDDSLGRP